MKNATTAATVAAMILFTVGQSHALVVCAKDDGTGQPKEKSKLVLKTACTAGKEVPIGIAVTGTVGVDARVEVYQADLSVTEGNLQVTSGSGATAGAVNGKGNVIVGYNEGSGGQTRTGSHNIVVGREHEYTSFGGLVVGQGNTISGWFSSVTGGLANTASGDWSTVSGGATNTASSNLASVSGGTGNTASGPLSSVSGGQGNTASGIYSSVSGGASLTSSGNNEWHAGQTAGFPTGTQY